MVLSTWEDGNGEAHHDESNNIHGASGNPHINTLGYVGIHWDGDCYLLKAGQQVAC